MNSQISNSSAPVSGSGPHLSWSATRFASADLRAYAEAKLLPETRSSLELLSLVLLFLSAVGMPLCLYFDFERSFEYTYVLGYALVVVLCLHTYLSAKRVDDLRALHMLGMTLLIVSAISFLFIAHRTHELSPLLMVDIVLVFMAIPMLPWGTREALLVTALIYSTLSLSVLGVAEHFEPGSVITLQFLMLGAALISTLLVARSARIRRDDLIARFDLEKTKADLYELSNIDPLTGAYNRRYLDEALARMDTQARAAGNCLGFTILDVDDFKRLNDELGHEAGDYALKLLVETLNDRLGERATVLRFGGDEFVVLTEGGKSTSEITTALDAAGDTWRVQYGLKAPALTVSTGSAEPDEQDTLDADRIYRKADLALYERKRQRVSRRATVSA